MMKSKKTAYLFLICLLFFLITGCDNSEDNVKNISSVESLSVDNAELEILSEKVDDLKYKENLYGKRNERIRYEDENAVSVEGNEDVLDVKIESIVLEDSMSYACNSKIHSDPAFLYNSLGAKGNIVVCINAGHGTNGGTQVKTLCHPDGSPKVTGGSTAAGAVEAIAVSSGMQFPDGTPEKEVTLRQAIILKEILLDSGYSVLMIRESDDVQLDNVARTVIANQYADCHIALHWDSSENDKGAFYCSVPNIESYRRMEPVASTWEKSHLLGDCFIEGLRSEGVKIYAGGSMAIDLTQTSYSSIASIDLELGDKGSDYSDDSLRKNALGILEGIDRYFGFSSDLYDE